MNKAVKLAGLFSIVGLLALVACEKDDTGSTSTTTSGTATTATTSSTSSTSTTSGSRADLLTGGSAKIWRVTEMYYNDTLEPLDPCQADDKLTFAKAGSTYTVTRGTIKCETDETDDSGTWALTDNDTKLEIDGDFSFTIQEMTATRIVVTSMDTMVSENPGGGGSTTEIVTAKQVWIHP